MRLMSGAIERGKLECRDSPSASHVIPLSLSGEIHENGGSSAHEAFLKLIAVR